MFRKLIKVAAVVLLVGVMYVGFTRQPTPAAADGRVHITYWEKWTGFEADAMRKVVDRFNRRQDRIFVDMLTISQIDRKLLMATAGGVPPDVVGLWSNNVSNFADKQVLRPLDDLLARDHITRADYIPAYYDLGEYQGHMYALPTTPASVALHWNKGLFREAGLDPNRPPRTLEELDEYAARLTKRDAKGHLVQMGFMPNEPGWWNGFWGYYFGGTLWNGSDRITTDSPENERAYGWVRSYSKRYGVGNVQLFRSGFGNFSSPQNAFLSGKVAMELQGVWMGNFIDKYAPGMDWAAAPFPYPAAHPELAQVAYVETDTISIPVGATHPQEAWEFIKYVNSQEGMELLCLEQHKHTPLATVSKAFIAKHPNPYITVFIDVAKRAHTFSAPKTPIANEYTNEMDAAFDEIWLGTDTPEAALARVRVRMQEKLDRRFDELAPQEGNPMTAVARRPARPRLARRHLWAGLAFVSPWLIGLGVFMLYPVVASLYYSFCDYSVLERAYPIGLGNYLDLFRDQLFLKALLNTAFYAVLSVPLGLFVALALAMLLNSGVRGLTVYRTIFFLPALVPMVALAVLWLWIFNGEYGVLNIFLGRFHVPGPGWLTDPNWSKPALVLLSVWGMGHAMVIFLAGLQDVPVHLYEAADLDGASWWHKIRHVTLPMVSPVLLFNGIMGLIGSLQFFAVPYIMAPNGQPARSAYFYAMYLYDNAFLYLRMGYASAMAWVLFLLILALTLLSLRLASRYVHYEAG